MSLENNSVQTIFIRVLAGLILLAFLGQVSLRAQSTGTISGTVSDATGAVIPGAEISVRNVETGLTRALTSNERGRYAVPQLPPGSYEISASTAGFQTEVRRGITLTIGREAVVDFSLSVGAVAERVEVTGEAPLIETTTSTVSGMIDSKQMRDIPLNSRSFIELVGLQPGAVLTEGARTTGSTDGFGRKISVAGTRGNNSSFLLDGANINNASNTAGSAATTVAGVETVREFRVITNAYDAEYGRHTGGVIAAVTKSGTNDIHGSVFEFLRNDNLDAPRWEDNAFFGGKKPEFRRNQFGGTVGGPVIKNRTFYFGSYEGLRQGVGQTSSYTVPGQAMRQGIVRGVSIPIDPAIRPYMDAYPLPNEPDRADGTARLVRSDTETTKQNYAVVRVDHRINDSNFLFGRFLIDNAEVVTPSFTVDGLMQTANRFVTVEGTHIFSPQLLGRANLSFNRTPNRSYYSVQEGFQYPNDFWSFDGRGVPGRFSVSGLSGWGGMGGGSPRIQIQNQYTFKGDFNYSRGRHALKFGGGYERIQFNQRSDLAGGGSFSFASLENFLTNTADSASFTRPGSNDIRGWRQRLVGLYLHDDFSVRPGLTLNLGIRYEFITVPTEVNGQVANIRDMSEPHRYTVTADTTDVGDPYFLNPSLKNFAPRVGFAWTPFQSGKTSVRGGFGIFHEQILPNLFITVGARLAPFYAEAILYSRDGRIDFPRAYFTQQAALIAGTGASKPSANVFDFSPEQPYAAKWSLDIQQELPGGLTATAGYSGTRGIHLTRGELVYNSTPAVERNGRLFILIDEPMPNPNINKFWGVFTDADSFYHAARFGLQKRLSQGVQFQVSYTFQKSLDTASHGQGAGNYDAEHVGRFYRQMHWKGPSAFDLRQSFYTSFLYELPGRSLTGAAGQLLGGWSLSGILRLNSGNPLDISAARPRKGTKQAQYVYGPTLDLVPGGNNNPVDARNPDKYFDPSQFSYPLNNCLATPATATFPCDPSYPSGIYYGNLGRNTLTSPGVANMDVTLIKDTRLVGENVGLQFRAEFFNLFNRANFDNPSTSVFDNRGRPQPAAGEIRTTRLSPRQMQLALKLIF
ncbi:MAG: TonB-dependent receptor [Acidobacteria bacterium]|nr:TonB-dependent receptor [Acidobacteriota bacterium]